MQLFKKTKLTTNGDHKKKQICQNDRKCAAHWSWSPWTGNNSLICAALAHQSNVVKRCRANTQHDCPDGFGQIKDMRLCNKGTWLTRVNNELWTGYLSLRGAGGGWHRHSQPSSGSIWWCWWTDRWAVRCSAIFSSYFLPRPQIRVRRLCRERSLTGPWHPNLKVRPARKGCAKHIFQMFSNNIKCFYSSFACSKELWNTSLCFDVIKGTHPSLITRPETATLSKLRSKNNSPASPSLSIKEPDWPVQNPDLSRTWDLQDERECKSGPISQCLS